MTKENELSIEEAISQIETTVKKEEKAEKKLLNSEKQKQIVSSDSQIHRHHRKRKIHAFLENGFSSFAPHEILELILFYSIPRKDTNPLAHQLIDRYGSLENVMDAPASELLEINGITENTVALLRLIPALEEYYTLSKLKKHRLFDTVEKAADFFIEYYQNKTEEVVTALFLDNSSSFIAFEELHHGSVNSSDVNPRKIAEIALSKKAASLILAHNHPKGTAEPSDMDIRTTKNLYTAFSGIHLQLRASLIIAGSDYSDIFDSIYNHTNFEVRYLLEKSNVDDENIWTKP